MRLIHKSKLVNIADAIREKIHTDSIQTVFTISFYLQRLRYENEADIATLTLTGIIPDSAYEEIADYEKVVFDGVTSVGTYAFKNSTISKLEFKNSADCVISQNAFYDCDNLKNIAIDDVDTIKTSAFSSCNNLLPIWLSKNIKTIGADAFRGCLLAEDLLGKSKPDYTKIYTDATSKPSGWATNWDEIRQYSSWTGSTQLKASVYYGVSKERFLQNMALGG